MPGRIGITSPDGNIHFFLEAEKGILKYSVYLGTTPVIEPSGMGMVVDGKAFGEDAVIGKITRSGANETYPYRGVHSKAINHFNGATIEIVSNMSSFKLEAKVFNDGVAFRYVIPRKTASVTGKDLTRFTLPAGSSLWAQNNIKNYEGKYGKKKIEEFVKGDPIGPPVTVELPGNAGYAAITEGGLVDFAGLSLIADSDRVLDARLAGDTHKAGVIVSPWRIVETGRDLNTLVNCDIIANVSPGPDTRLFPQGVETEWVRPGRSVWSWLAGNRSITLENMKRFTDYAAALGFEYNLVDEGWSNWKDSSRDNWAMMKELVDYSAAKKVKIWVWKAYPDRKGIPGIKDPGARKAFFEKCRQTGIAGIKIDFFDSEAQDVIDFYQAALKDGARLHLMIDFHGANKPTGETRTWPNEMSREAIRGMENRPPWAPMTAILPFTRFLAGHADYTPLHFGNRMGEVSWAQQVATMVVFTSPLLCLGADPQSILDNPCKEIIQAIPSIWDETIVLPQSRIGDLALFARRKGKTWFVAAINGIGEARTLSIDLSFLPAGDYSYTSIEDEPGSQAGALVKRSKLTDRLTHRSMSIGLNPSGGFVGIFKPSHE